MKKVLLVIVGLLLFNSAIEANEIVVNGTTAFGGATDDRNVKAILDGTVLTIQSRQEFICKITINGICVGSFEFEQIASVDISMFPAGSIFVVYTNSDVYCGILPN